MKEKRKKLMMGPKDDMHHLGHIGRKVACLQLPVMLQGVEDVVSIIIMRGIIEGGAGRREEGVVVVV